MKAICYLLGSLLSLAFMLAAIIGVFIFCLPVLEGNADAWLVILAPETMEYISQNIWAGVVFFVLYVALCLLGFLASDRLASWGSAESAE
jgi:hypothetical protein